MDEMNNAAPAADPVEFSPDIGKLAEALAAAQGEIKNATKKTMNEFFGKKYAELADVLDAVRDPLSKNKLAVIQAPGRTIETARGKLIEITTILTHSSGQWIKTRFYIPTGGKDTPQTWGGAITYARRYCLAALLGVAQEDDDANAASGRTSPAVPVYAPPQTIDKTRSVYIAKISATMKERGIKAETMAEYASATYGKTTVTDMTNDELNGVLNWLAAGGGVNEG